MKSDDKKVRILFWGTPEFAIPVLRALLDAEYQVVGVVTTPDRPAGRKQSLTSPPVKVFAAKHSIPVFQPETLKPAGYALNLPEADLFVVAAYGKIIPKAIIEKPRLGALNIHPSLLPRWRGPSPIQFTILSGDAETGVTIIEMDELMDHGHIVANSKFSRRIVGIPTSLSEKINGASGQILPIRNANRGSPIPQSGIGTISKMTYPELHDELAKAGAKLLIEILPKWIRGEIVPVPQDHSRATFCKILAKNDGRIDWDKKAIEIERQIRAFTPWPGSWTEWPRKDRVERIRIDAAHALDYEIRDGDAGYVSEMEKHPLLVKTGKGSLAVTFLTIEGGKTLAADSFVKGYSDIIFTSLV